MVNTIEIPMPPMVPQKLASVLARASLLVAEGKRRTIGPRTIGQMHEMCNVLIAEIEGVQAHVEELMEVMP